MGRELRRVPLNFDWPLNKVWDGFINPLHVATKCTACDGSGYSPKAKRLQNLWYGYEPFTPQDRGSTPFAPQDDAVRAFAERNVSRAPEFYGRDHWNGAWSHHLNEADVAALVEGSRLYDFTHIWSNETRWQPKVPAYMPSPREVNVWSISGMGHDSINQWICVKAECARLGVSPECSECDGDGEHWPSLEAKKAYEDWQTTPPPSGDAYQIWETVSEGSPISPPFATPDELARHMASTKWGADQGTPYKSWLSFIMGPGWAPSMVLSGGKMMSGVEAVVQ